MNEVGDGASSVFKPARCSLLEGASIDFDSGKEILSYEEDRIIKIFVDNYASVLGMHRHNNLSHSSLVPFVNLLHLPLRHWLS